MRYLIPFYIFEGKSTKTELFKMAKNIVNARFKDSDSVIDFMEEFSQEYSSAAEI